MPYVVLASRLSFQKTKADDPRVPDGPEEVVEKGGMVPTYATEFLVGTLTSAGLIAWVDTGADPGVTVGVEVPVQARTPDMPPVLPSDPNGLPPLLSDRDSADPVAVESVPNSADKDPLRPQQAQTELGALPKPADSKDAWEQYATHPKIGMTLEQAEAMTKADLMAEVKRRAADATK